MFFSLSKLLVAPSRTGLSCKISQASRTISTFHERPSKTPSFYHNETLDYEVRIAKQEDTPKILKFLENNLLEEDPLIKSLKLASLHPSLKNIYTEHICMGFSLLATKKTKGGNREIIGLSINSKNSAWDGKRLEQIARDVEDNQVKTLLNIYGLFSKAPNLNCRLNQLQVFEIGPLSIALDEQGKGIGAQIVKKSLGLARDMGYQWARMNCSCVGRKNLASQAGMQKMIEIPYKNILFESNHQVVLEPENPDFSASVYAMNLKKIPEGYKPDIVY